MLWYRLWLDTGNRQYLDDSVLYNEDDCRATRLIKDWLIRNSRLGDEGSRPPSGNFADQVREK